MSRGGHILFADCSKDQRRAGWTREEILLYQGRLPQLQELFKNHWADARSWRRGLGRPEFHPTRIAGSIPLHAAELPILRHEVGALQKYASSVAWIK